MDDEFEEQLKTMSLADRAKARVKGPGPYTIPLEYPKSVTFKLDNGGRREEVLSEITIRRPGMKEVTDSAEQSKKHGNMGGIYWLMAKLSDLPEAAIHQLDPDDFAEVEAVIEVFMEKFQKGQTTSSET